MLLKNKTFSLLLQLTVAFGLPQASTSLAPSTETDIETDTAPDLGLTLATLSCPPSSSKDFERLTQLLPKILDNAVSRSNKSWEIGTVTQALLEVYDPHFAPFQWDASAYQGRQIPWRVLEITKTAMADYDWTGSPGQLGGWYDKRQEDKGTSGASWLKEFLSNDTARVPLRNQALMNGSGSLGDPCSVGPAVWMLGQLAERKEVRSQGYKDPQDYAWAVGNQYGNLISGPEPDTHNGTYSQREGEFSVWADMGYMIPPFLAHLGLSTDSSDFLKSALKQHELETSALLDPTTHLFRHLNEHWDLKFWATGNGWMTYGLVRVLASVIAAGKKDEFQAEIDAGCAQLVPIFTSLFDQLDVNSTLPNYMLTGDAIFGQSESAGTALVLAAFHRFEVIAPWLVTDDMRAKAETAFSGVMKFVQDDGWLTQVVDPSGDNGFNVDPNAKSAEGQSFMGMLWAAKLAAIHFRTKTEGIASGVTGAFNGTSGE